MLWIGDEDAAASGFLPVLTSNLARIGLVSGVNIIIDIRSAKRGSDQLDKLAAELVALKPEVILAAGGTRGARAAKRATSTVPIVFLAVGDAVRAGLVESMAAPGGNLTGASVMANELDIKRVQILGEVLPAEARIAVIDIPDVTEDYLVQKMGAMNQALDGKAGRIVRFVVPTGNDLDTTFERIAQQRINALSVNETPFATDNSAHIAALITKYKLAAIAFGRSFSKLDVLMTYSADFNVLQHAVECIDKILKGAKPAEMPIEQPTQFRFVVNLKIAKALGIKMPNAVLARADELIE